MRKAHQLGDRLGVRWEAPDGEKELAFFHHQGLPSGPDVFVSGHPALRGSLSDLQNCAFKTVKSVCPADGGTRAENIMYIRGELPSVW
jgi:hypothetical protein